MTAGEIRYKLSTIVIFKWIETVRLDCSLDFLVLKI